ncbi:MAG: LptF/LptG family permease [SAR324 cluster bacterium]|nr:LptF/LptG family permease [SAR324 cluster bacterium]
MILLRAVFLELFSPFALTLLVMAGLLMMEKAYRLINLVVERRLNLGEVGLMLVYVLPQVLAVTIPLGVVGAVFVTVVRQSMDSEVISMRAAGRGLWNYALPFVGFGLLMSLITAVVTVWLQPTAYRKYAELQVEMVRWRAEEKLVPGELNYDFGDKVIRIGGRRSEKELSDIFISNRVIGDTTSVIAAQSGWIEVDDAVNQVVFRLRDGTVYTLVKGSPAFRTVRFDTLRYVLEYEPVRSLEVRTIRTLSTRQLLDILADEELTPQAGIGYGRELQRRLASPWSCLAFALASLPMALVDPRSGRRAGYLRAIFLVLAYFIVWAAFKDLVGGGKASPYTLWLPALLIFFYGILRLWQLNADIEILRRVFHR